MTQRNECLSHACQYCRFMVPPLQSLIKEVSILHVQRCLKLENCRVQSSTLGCFPFLFFPFVNILNELSYVTNTCTEKPREEIVFAITYKEKKS